VFVKTSERDDRRSAVARLLLGWGALLVGAAIAIPMLLGAIASSTWLIVVVSAILLLLLVTTSLVMVSVTRASLRR